MWANVFIEWHRKRQKGFFSEKFYNLYIFQKFDIFFKNKQTYKPVHELFTFVINLFVFQFIFKLVVHYSSLKRLSGENDLKSEYVGDIPVPSWDGTRVVYFRLRFKIWNLKPL